MMAFLNSIRLFARAFFVTAILLAMSLVFFTGPAKADKPTPQTSGGSPRSGGAIGDLPVGSTNGMNPELLIPLTTRARAQQADGSKEIFGREVEADSLEINLMESTQAHRVVEITGAPGTGIRTLVELHARNSSDLIFELDAEKLSGIASYKEMVEKFGGALNYMNEQAKAHPGTRVILLISNASVLKTTTISDGAAMQPLQVLVQKLASRPQFYTIFSAQAKTFDDQEIFKRFPEIKAGIVKQEILPPSYESVRDYLIFNIDKLEAAIGRQFSTAAIEEVARIKVKFFAARGFDLAWQLAIEAGREAERIEKNGGDRVDRERKRQLVRQLEREAKMLQRETSPEMQARLKDVATRLANAQVELSNAKQDLNQKFDLAQTEVEVMALEAERDQIKNREVKKGLFGSSSLRADEKARIVAIGEKLRALEVRKVALENEINTAVHGKEVERGHVLMTASRRLKIPVEKLTATFSQGLENFDEYMYRQIFGQDHALEQIRDSLLVRETKLNDGINIETKAMADSVLNGTLEDGIRPVASYWFAGNTGVGKTETANQLALLLGYRPITLNMSEFGEKHMVARLIGAPAGYIGYGEPGELTGKVTTYPDSVILFDEIEKAHPDMLKIMLQILDSGTLTDSQGRVSKFNRAIVIVTSNLAQEIAGMGFREIMTKLAAFRPEAFGGTNIDQIFDKISKKNLSDTNAAKAVLKELAATMNKTEDGKALWARLHSTRTGDLDLTVLRSEVYKSTVTDVTTMGERGLRAIPREIVARFDNLIVFNDVDETVALKIFEKNLKNLLNRLKHFYGVNLHFSQTAFETVTKRFNTQGGGRDMRRVLLDTLSAPLARMIWNKRILPGQVVVADLDAYGAVDFAPVDQEDYVKAVNETVSELNGKAVSGDALDAQLKGLESKAPTAAQSEKARAAGELVKSLTEPGKILHQSFMKRLRGIRGR